MPTANNACNTLRCKNAQQQPRPCTPAVPPPAAPPPPPKVGTPSNLQCYDVDQNKDLFFKEIGDGVNTMVAGPFGRIDYPLVLVGGNCSIQVNQGS